VGPHGRRLCSCPSGWSGKKCNIRLNACRRHPCHHGGYCADTGNGAFKCVCAVGWGGPTCGHRINSCSARPCLNGGRCVEPRRPLVTRYDRLTPLHLRDRRAAKRKRKRRRRGKKARKKRKRRRRRRKKGKQRKRRRKSRLKKSRRRRRRKRRRKKGKKRRGRKKRRRKGRRRRRRRRKRKRKRKRKGRKRGKKKGRGRRRGKKKGKGRGRWGRKRPRWFDRWRNFRCICVDGYTGIYCEQAPRLGNCASHPCKEGQSCTEIEGGNGYACNMLHPTSHLHSRYCFFTITIQRFRSHHFLASRIFCVISRAL